MTIEQLNDLEEVCFNWITEHILPSADAVEVARELHHFSAFLAGSTFTAVWEQRYRDGVNDALEDI